MSDYADDLRLRQQAEAAARDWQRAGRDPSHLWPHERLVLVERAFQRLGIRRSELDDPARTFLRSEAERLLEELERTHFRRAEIGDRLDTIGDPRPGVGLRPDGLPDIVWCAVPGGTVELEGVEGSSVVEPFAIAKYPITYRQYRAFLEDPQGYRDERWWKRLAHEEAPGEQVRPTGTARPKTSHGTMRWPTAGGSVNDLARRYACQPSGSGNRPRRAAGRTTSIPGVRSGATDTPTLGRAARAGPRPWACICVVRPPRAFSTSPGPSGSGA